eukprot:6098501-Pyramimonas_sp.AAC.2
MRYVAMCSTWVVSHSRTVPTSLLVRIELTHRDTRTVLASPIRGQLSKSVRLKYEFDFANSPLTDG